MAVVSVAITLSFHLKSEPTHLELRMAKPLGGIFWVLSVLMLLAGMGNYISTLLCVWNLGSGRLLTFNVSHGEQV